MGSYGFIFYILYMFNHFHMVSICSRYFSACHICHWVKTPRRCLPSIPILSRPYPTLSDFTILSTFSIFYLDLDPRPVNAKTYDGRKRIEKVLQVLRSWDSWDILRNLETFEDFIMSRIPRRLVLCDMLSILSQYPYSIGFSLACHYIHMHKPYSWQLSSSNESENVDYGWKRCACTRLGLAAWIGSRIPGTGSLDKGSVCSVCCWAIGFITNEKDATLTTMLRNSWWTLESFLFSHDIL